MAFSSQHHSFDIALAAQHGVEKAILIHHFQHWVRFNRARGQNIIDGRCWTYQARKDIKAHFPYWSYEEVKHLCEQLEKDGVLITANYNKKAMDRTLWYAFVDEKAYAVDADSQIMFTKRENSLMQKGDVPNALGKCPSAIPDSKPDTKTKDKIKTSHPNAEALGLAQQLLRAIKKTKDDIKEPNLEKWAQEVDRMIRIDKRDPIAIGKVIGWLPTNYFWAKNILSADKLREQFDRLQLEMAMEPKKKPFVKKERGINSDPILIWESMLEMEQRGEKIPKELLNTMTEEDLERYGRWKTGTLYDKTR